ncbi:MAG: molybdenum cofactor biosynthesis protein MoaE [Candidatus Bathyarchaeota archaeon]
MGQIRRIGISQKGTIALQDLLSFIRQNPDLKKGGAIATFTGIVRGYTHDGKKVAKLEVEASEDEAFKTLTAISKELRSRPGVIDVLIHHLVGEFFVGEDLVYVVVVGKSRSDAFQALEHAVDQYKQIAEIWKKEYLDDGTSFWVSE